MTDQEFQDAVRQYPRVHIWRRNEFGRRRRGTAYVVGFDIGPRGGHTARMVSFGLVWRHLAEQSDPGRLVHNMTRRADRRMMQLIGQGGLARGATGPSRRRRVRNRRPINVQYRANPQ